MENEKKLTIEHYFWYFVIFSVLGLVIETLYCYVYYYIYYVCWYRYRICIAQLAVFTENRKEYITHYLPAAVCFGNLYRLQQLNH